MYWAAVALFMMVGLFLLLMHWAIQNTQSDKEIEMPEDRKAYV